MAETIVTVTGNLNTLNMGAPKAGRVRFYMPRPDWDDDGNINASRYVEAVANANGDFSIGLQATTEYENGSQYRAVLHYSETITGQAREEHLGQFALAGPGPHALTSLLGVDIAEPVPADVLALCLAAEAGAESALGAAVESAAAASASAAAASASAAQAALYDGVWLDTVAAIRADTSLTYTAGQPGSVVAGDYVMTRDGWRGQVAASGAADHNEVTDGGVKIYDAREIENIPYARIRKLMTANMGYDGTAIFTNAGNAPQGFAIANVSGAKTGFIAQRTVSDDYKLTERSRIVFFTMRADGGQAASLSYTDELNIGHQSLSAWNETDGSVTMVAGMVQESGTEDDNAGKGFSVIDWQGGGTTQSNVTNYRVFGLEGSVHQFADYYQASVASDGRHVAILAKQPRSNNRFLFVYDLADVIAAADPLTVTPIVAEVPIRAPENSYAYVVQGLAVKDSKVAILYGWTNPRENKAIRVVDYSGNTLSHRLFDGARAIYTDDQLLSDATFGIPYALEPEGLAYDGTQIVSLHADFWRESGSVVSYGGKNFACIAASSTGEIPGTGNAWVVTDLAAGGAWAAGTTYTRGAAWTRKDKLILSIGAPLVSGADYPLLSGTGNQPAPAFLYIGGSVGEIAYKEGTALQIERWNEATQSYLPSLVYDDGRLRVYGRDGADYASYAVNASTGREIAELRFNGALENGGGINVYGVNDSSNPGGVVLFGREGSSNLTVVSFDSATGLTKFRPNNLGVSAIRASDGTNLSSTLPTGTVTEIGGLVHVNIRFSALSIAGMTGANNLQITGLTLAPSIETVLGSIVHDGVTLTSTYYNLVAVVTSAGVIQIRELKGGAANILADVSQFDGKTFTISGTFKAA
ncbi:MAG: hypothetical protein U5N55_01505 [Cypionkella sp.]|nr:hypothetical protein [Cypionkella sp.]